VQLADRVFVVTGASSGIGRAIALALADAGGRVALVGRRADRLEALAQQLGSDAIAIPTDVTTAEAPDVIAEAAGRAFGQVDGLVNCAGRGLAGKLLDLDVELLDEAFELNLVAPLRLIQRLVPAMVERGEGVVVNVSSPTARMGMPGIGGYAMTKAALDAQTEALRRELHGTGVRVVGVFPGVAESEFYDSILGGSGADREARPPARPAEAIAAAVVEGVRRDRREVWAMGAGERRRHRVLRLIGAITPRVLDRGLSGG
jgi:short-subunit dehydrogenase